MNNNFRIGDIVLVHECCYNPYRIIKTHRGVIETIKGVSNKHNNVHQYGIKVEHGKIFTDNKDNLILEKEVNLFQN